MWRLPTIVLPDGGEDQLWISKGRLTRRPVDGAEPLPGRYVLPGLVDAHAHLTLAPGEHGPLSAGREHRDRLLATWRAAGVLLLRDAGGNADLTLELARDPGSGVLAAGRFLASDGYYFPDLHEPVAAADLTAAALAQIAAGAQWVKLVGDFPYRLERGIPHTPSYPIEAVRDMIDAVHAAGGRVAAHTTTAHAAALVAAGVDSVEHGTELDEDTLRAMAASGAAWTPTLSAAFAAGPDDTDARRRARRSAATGTGTCCRWRTAWAYRCSPAATWSARSRTRSPSSSTVEWTRWTRCAPPPPPPAPSSAGPRCSTAPPPTW
jgi:imidazolonepropionase-like amidohydrolase